PRAPQRRVAGVATRKTLLRQYHDERRSNVGRQVQWERGQAVEPPHIEPAVAGEEEGELSLEQELVDELIVGGGGGERRRAQPAGPLPDHVDVVQAPGLVAGEPTHLGPDQDQLLVVEEGDRGAPGG